MPGSQNPHKSLETPRSYDRRVNVFKDHARVGFLSSLQSSGLLVKTCLFTS
ncbi:MAG: hypothetical protein OER56_13705 [Hyphomicrobiales bacterium]|nr:hypothetical protein [Hyphomicrobiales bacterium]